jgi:hypothetical protein
MFIRMRRFFCLLGLKAAFCLPWFMGVTPAKAALIAYEGFVYAAGENLTNASAQGSGGSFGWGGRWTGANNGIATNQAVSLFYTDSIGNILVTNGGSVVIGSPGGTTANSQPSRSFNFGTLAGSTYSGLAGPASYWVSFVMQWVGPVTANSSTNQYVRKGDLAFRSGALTNATSTGTATFTVGSPNAGNRLDTPVDTWATWSGNDAGGGVQNTGLAVSGEPLNAPTFVLLRVDLDGGPGFDTVYTWFNWTNISVEPAIETASTTNNSANVDGWNNIRFDANGGNASGTNTVLAVDEFRLGNYFSDVTPHASGSVQPPTITVQPVNVTTTETYPAMFSVSVLGAEPIRYQWYFNTNTLLINQTNASMTISNVQPVDAGAYLCIVTNDGGAVTSSVATLTVLAPVLPGITTQPQSATNSIGFSTAFSVVATGSAPLSYQWYVNTGTLLTNQTNSILSFIITSPTNVGNYFVIVTNKFGSITSDVVTLTVSAFSLSQLPAFPGADGAAKLVSGGRGGTVYHVTRLDKNFDDVSPGTLRFGLQSVPGPKTIVFDVAGVFWLGRYGAESNHNNGWNAGQSRLNWSGNTTIAGQTAPGPVIIMGGVTKFGSVNTILRNVTIATGYGMQGFHEPPNTPTPGDFPDSYVYDAIDISGNNFLMDHLTTLYITDEAISCNEEAYNLTVQNCNISQGQNYPQADAEASGVSFSGHALAHLLQAGSNAKISILNNLYAHNKGRLPRVGSEVGTGALNDFRNNVFYNWLGTAGGGGGSQPSFNNFLHNFYLAGPGGEDPAGGANSNLVVRAGGTDIFGGGSGTRAHVSGNLRDINKDGDPNDASSADANFTSITASTTAYDINIGLTLSARDTFTNVLRHVGSRWWERPYDFTLGNSNAITTNDINAYINQRLIKETATGSGKIIGWADNPFDNDPNEGWEWRSLLALRADSISGNAPFNHPAGWDTDQDGMPDTWETARGLNPNVSNNNGDFDNDGYTDLEEYLNELAAWPAPGTVFFTGDDNNRYAKVFNWRVNGVQVNVTNLGNNTTFSFWQPSRYDTVLISNKTVYVDAVGQHAGILRLTNNAMLQITNGWLNVATHLENSSGCTVMVYPGGSLTVSNVVNNGTLRLIGATALSISGTFTNTGTLDVMSWNGSLPSGLVNQGTILDGSLIAISDFELNGADFSATIQGYDGHTYQLQYHDDLASEGWLDVGTAIPGTGNPINFTHSGGATEDQRFYRVIVD